MADAQHSAASTDRTGSDSPWYDQLARRADTLGSKVFPWALIAAGLLAVVSIVLNFPLNAWLYLALALVLIPLTFLLALPALFADLTRFRPSRIWAISSVTFREALRRRVLWVTPLAILGVIAVSQFTKAVDPQDAIRQATKACVFASGLVLVVTIIILACTNLPREIDSRVIYTIVTKPTTRLEIVLGKVLGFAKVSGAILLIMGLFSLGYLRVREWQLVRGVRAQIAAGALDEASQPLMRYYAEAGLLGTKSTEAPDLVQVLARPPVPGEPLRLTGGESQQYMLPFSLNDDEKSQIAEVLNAGGGLLWVSNVGYERRTPTEEEVRSIHEMNLPTVEGRKPKVEGPVLPPPSLAPGAAETAPTVTPIPQIQLQVLDANMVRIVNTDQIGGGKPVELPADSGEPRPVPAPMTGDAIQKLLQAGKFVVSVTGMTPSIEYLVNDKATVLVLVDPNGQPVATYNPSDAPRIQSAFGRYGMQVRGSPSGKGSVAVFTFKDAERPRTQDGKATVEIRVGIEGSSRDFETEEDVVARMNVQVRNHASGQVSEPVVITPEHNRANYVRVPEALIEGGNFDVYVRGLNPGQWYGLDPAATNLVVAERSFEQNLLKSLTILWLLAVLVVVIAVFCSTFLSWPVAVVLTLVLLLGRWGVAQLGDATGSGLGSEVTQGLGLDDPTSAKIMRESVNALSSFLNVVSMFLPDITRFSATEDIERGVSIPGAKLGEAAWVLLLYGLPLTVLTYVILRRKEVAP